MKINTNKLSFPKIIINSAFIIYSVLCIVPLLVVLAISFSSEISLSTSGYHILPKQFSLDAYMFIFKGGSVVWNAYLVTVLVTVVGTLLHLLISSMLAYAISRKEVKYANVVSFIVFFCLLFSGGIVPWYILLSKYLHMGNSIIVLIFPYLVSAINVLIMKNFFKATPESVLESARIDGSSEVNTFFKIVVPISKPVFATIGLFTAVFFWNDWMTCSLFINDSKYFSLQFLLQSIMNNIAFLQGSTMGDKISANLPNESARMATCILAVGPILLAYPFLQKYFESGLTLGAVKG